jgi:hypothetical protein
VAIIINIRTGKYSDGIYVPGISGYVILKRINSCQAKNLRFKMIIKISNRYFRKS